MKKTIIYLIVLALLLSFVPPTVYAAKDSVEKKYITVDVRGTKYTQTVYEASNGKIFVPITMLTQFGGMSCSKGSSKYTFYYKSETSGGKPVTGARRIFIDKSGKSGQVVCYTSQSNYTTVESITFSKAQTVNSKLYLPLEEFLPLFNAKVEITKDGILHIYNNPVSVYSAVLGKNLELFAFDSDDYFLDEVITASGLLVSTILGRFDRLDVINHTGEIKDYSNLFKKLLTDNETYLSAFDSKKTPLDKTMSALDGATGDLNDAIGGTKDMLSLAKYMSTSSLHETYKDFSDAVDKFGNKADAVEAAIKVFDYANAYYNQVDDHRNMLLAVYPSGSKPAAVAANEVYNIYGANLAGKVTAAATNALRNYISKEISKIVVSSLDLKPYTIAVSAVKLVLPGATGEFSKAAEMYFLDKVVQDARKTTENQLKQMKFDKASLEKLRLSLMMTLVASKYGYETHGKTDLVPAINSSLEKLYLAADSVECVAKGYYATKKSELSKSVKYITPSGGTSGGTQKPTEPPVQKPTEPPVQKPTEPSVQKPTEPSIPSVPKGLYYDEYDTYCVVIWYEEGTDTDIVIPSIYHGLPVTAIDEGAFSCCDGLSSVTIPNSVTTIGEHAFQSCSSLTSITIPDSVTSIGDYAFSLCPNLTNVTIGSGVLSIGERAFWDSARLTNITIPDSVTSIGIGAFDGCDGLTSITIPDSVTSIGDYAFEDCDGLSNVVFNGKVGQWKSISKSNKWDGWLSSLEVICVDGIAGECGDNLSWGFTDGVLTISGQGEMDGFPFYIAVGGYECWCGSSQGQNPWVDIKENIQTIVIEEGVTSIVTGAFSWAKNLRSVIIPDSVIKIDDFAFVFCNTLTDVSIQKSSQLSSIGNGAFYGCKSLKEICIPSKVQEIGEEWGLGTFGDCENLKNVKFAEDIQLSRIEEGTFADCTNLATICIPDSVTNIGEEAFAHCDNLTNITYEGTAEQWKSIQLADEKSWRSWNLGVPATEVICSDGKVSLQ